MNPLSKSLWIAPAACGARHPLGIVQHLISFSPATYKSAQISSRTANCEQTSKVILQAELSKSFSDNLRKFRRDLALLEKLGLCSWIISHAVELFLKLDRERDDVSGNASMLGDPLGYGRQVLALLSEIILHRQVDEVYGGLGGDQLYLLADERNLGRCPASVSDWLILLQHLSHHCEHTENGWT